MGTMALFSSTHGEKKWFIWLQFTVDALFITMLLCSGNSYQNPFVLLFSINILAAASFGNAQDVFWVTLLDVFCYILVQYLAIVQIIHWELPANALVFYVKVVSEIFGLFLIGGLGVFMAVQQALTTETLREQILTTRLLRRRHIDVLNELPTGLFLSTGFKQNSVVLIPQNRIAESWYQLPNFLKQLLRNEERWNFVLNEQQFQVQKVSLPTEEQLLMVEDVTHIREMERLVAKEEQLALVGRFSASLAHEIRNPIASLSGAVQLLAEQGKSRLHTIILREVNRINELVDLFLKSASSQHLKLEFVSISPIIHEVLEALRLDPRTVNVQFTIESDDEVILEVDPAKIRQVIWNLLINGVQATENGNLYITTSVSDKTYSIRIRDTGKGIGEESLPKIFDPFFTTRAGGTGLGLYVVQQIIKSHKGTIEYESSIGKGTVVHLQFPLINVGVE